MEQIIATRAHQLPGRAVPVKASPSRASVAAWLALASKDPSHLLALAFSSLAGRARLPTLGESFRADARAQGLDDMALSSPMQRLWQPAALLALRTLSEGGARMDGFVFYSRDERPGAAGREALCAAGPEALAMADLPPPWCPSRAATFFLDDGSTLPAGSSLEGPEAAPTMAALAAALGSETRARVFAVAHEWAHCWQALRGFPAGAAAARMSHGRHAACALAYLDDLSRRERFSQPGPAGAALRLVEESFCDAAGAWTVEAAGLGPAASQVAAFRDRRRAVESDPSYGTSEMLMAALPPGYPFPRRFPDFAERALAAIAPIGARAFGSRRRIAKPCLASSLGPTLLL